MAQRVLSLLVALVFVTTLGLPVIAAEPESTRSVDDSLGFDFAWGALEPAEGTPKELDAGWQRYVVDQLSAAKRELLELERSRQVALAKFPESHQSCERESVERSYRVEKQRLQENIRALRQIRGDKREFFAKAWHKIGPSGRRVLRAFGNESVEILKSGGTLQGGVARRILIRLGRKELESIAIRAVARKVYGRSARAIGAAEDECRDEEPRLIEPTATGKLGQDLPPAIPAGTYSGTFDEATILDSAWSDGDPEIRSNAIEVHVAEDGSVSGRFEYEERGLAIPPDDPATRCPGGGSKLMAKIKPGQVIGPTLPQALEISIEFILYTAYLGEITPKAVVHFCVPPRGEAFSESYEATITGYADGKLAGSAVPWLFELTRREGGGSDEDAPWDREAE